jgi:hypothetical protein
VLRLRRVVTVCVARAASAPMAAAGGGGADETPAEPTHDDKLDDAAAAGGEQPKAKWKEFKTKEGKPYYYDSVSKKTQVCVAVRRVVCSTITRARVWCVAVDAADRDGRRPRAGAA